MLPLKLALLVVAFGMFLAAAAILLFDARQAEPPRWRASLALALMAWAPLLLALSILVVSA